MSAVHSSIQTVTIPDKASLYKNYMGFLRNGGLFVPTQRHYELNEEMFVLVILPEETERRPVSGRVAWVSPAHASGRPQGVGLQFSDTPENDSLRTRIEVLLAGHAGDKATHTM